MYVYVWKDPQQTPFYVGLTVRLGRTNPRNYGNRNWLCKQKLADIGADNVIVEFHTVPSIEEGQALECKLIKQYGRLQTGTGPLTNLRSGGEGMHSPTEEHRAKLRAAMLSPDHPIHSEASRSKAKKRMNDPDVKAKFMGENNAAKRPEVRAKIKAVWDDPAYRAARIAERIGVPKHTEEHKQIMREKLLDPTNPMREYHKILNTDPDIRLKRTAGIRAAQPQRAAKMTDPIAIAQRKARVTATLNSPEYKAKRALFDTPEYRKKLSDGLKAAWAKKKGMVLISRC